MAKTEGPKYHTISNCKFPPSLAAESIEFALNYKPLNTDKFVVTYPKCGTTWVQQIMYLILNDGMPQSFDKQFMWNSYIEFKGKDYTKNEVIKTHLPFNLMPYNKFAKYLYVLRNPKDTCVSFYHHIKTRPLLFEGDFHHFFQYWIKGEVYYGDYFQHVLPFWSHRFDDNFTFLVYEHIKNNTRDAVLKVAEFLGDEYVVKLKQNDELLMKKVVENSTIDSMKIDLKSNEFLVRKGIVGDWKSHFNKAESDLIDHKVRECFTGTGLQELWAEDMKW